MLLQFIFILLRMCMRSERRTTTARQCVALEQVACPWHSLLLPHCVRVVVPFRLCCKTPVLVEDDQTRLDRSQSDPPSNGTNTWDVKSTVVVLLYPDRLVMNATLPNTTAFLKRQTTYKAIRVDATDRYGSILLNISLYTLSTVHSVCSDEPVTITNTFSTQNT